MKCVDWFCGRVGRNLRKKCFIIGYMNLVASIVDIVFHMVIISIVTNGLECDVDRESLEAVNWPWLEPILLFINLGTHGFYPFPLVIENKNNAYLDYMPIVSQRRCYPGMLHLSVIDVLNFLINTIWLRLVISFISGIYRKDLESLRMFLGISSIKLILQVMYFTYKQKFYSVLDSDGYWFIKLMDILMAALFLLVIYKYIQQLRSERTKLNVEQPPSYIECLITEQLPIREKKDVAILPVESIVNIPAQTPKT